MGEKLIIVKALDSHTENCMFTQQHSRELCGKMVSAQGGSVQSSSKIDMKYGWF